jgi:hypothetical protein
MQHTLITNHPPTRRALELCRRMSLNYAGPRSARLGAVLYRMSRSRESARRNLHRAAGVARAYLNALSCERGEA